MSKKRIAGRRGNRAWLLTVAAIASGSLTSPVGADTFDGSGGNGAWSTAINWADNTEPTSADPVIFPTPNPFGITSIALSAGGEQAQSITFNDNYTMGAGFVTLFGAGGPIGVASGKTVSISSVINGTGLNKTGAGTLNLTASGNNGYSGQVQISGVLSVTKDTHLGNASNAVLITPSITGGTLQIKNTFSTARVISVGAFGGTISVDSARTYTVNAGLGAGSNSLTVNGLGTLWLNNASTRSGNTTIQNGTVHLGNGTGLGTGGYLISNNGTLEIGAGITAAGTTFLDQLGKVRSSGAGAVHGGTVLVDASASEEVFLNSGDSASHSLSIGDYRNGSGATTRVNGSGAIILSGSNNYSGAWAVDSGTLRLTHADAITSSASPIVINSGGTVEAQATSNYAGVWTVGGLLRVLANGGTGTASSNVNVNSGGVLQIEGVSISSTAALNSGGTIKGIGAASTGIGAITAANSSSTLTLASSATSTDTLTVNNYTGGTGSTTHVSGSGEVILSSANTYAGNWEIDSGTLRVDNAAALGSNTSPVLVDGGTLRLHGPTITRNITMNNGSTLLGSFNGSTTGRPNGTLSIAPAAAVTFRTADNLHTMLIGDSTNDLTGGGGGSTITIAPNSPVALVAASNYVGNWILRSSLQPGNDNRFGDAANTVTLDSGGLLCFSSFTTSRQFIIAGTSALQVFGGTMTFNSGLTGTFDTLQTSGTGIVLNAAGSVTGNSVLVDGILKMNHNSALSSVPFQVLGGGGQLELGTGVTLSQNATMHNTAVLRGNNNTLYGGTITIDTVGGDDVTLATTTNTDTFTIGNGVNDLTGGGVGSVITAAGPGRIVLAQQNNVTADWLITGGLLEIGSGNRLGNAGSVTVNGFAALQLANAGMTNIDLILQNGALWASGVSSYSESGNPQIANSGNLAITVLGASDVLSIGSAFRNVTAGASTAALHVNGAGRLVLQSGGTSAADIYSGSWVQSSGILQVGQTNGNGINGLGFKNGDAKQANSIRVNGGTLAVGVVGSGANTPDWLRANVTLAGGAIALTNIVNGRFGGDLILEASTTSRVLVFDPANPTIETDVHLAGGAAGLDNNAAVTDWRFNSQLIVDPGTNNGGQFTIQRDGGTVSVDGSVCALIINDGAQVDLGGTADALSDGVEHVNVVNDGAFFVTQGSKNIGSLSGSSTGVTFTLPGTSLTVHQHVSAPAGLIGNSGSFIKEGPGTLSVFSIGGGAITINDGAIISSSGPAVEAGESITLSGGDLTLPSLYSNGQVTVNSGSTLTTDLLTAGNDGTLSGGSGTGNILVDGGSVSAKKILLGSSAGGSGTLNVKNGGTVTSEGIASNLLVLNNTANTTVTVSAPAFPSDPILDGSVVSGYVHDGHIGVNVGTLTTPKIKLGVTAGKTGSFNHNGGTVNVTTLGVGNDGTATGGAGIGTFVCTGAVPNVTNLIIGSTAGGVGEMTIGSNFNHVLKVATLSIDSGAGNRLDLTDAKLILTTGGVGSWNGSEYSGLTGLIQRGRGDGTWNGSGVVTSKEDATTSVLTTLAIGDADELGYAGGTFGGVSVSSGDALVMYTWGGDADLNGELNGDDYFYLDSNILQSGSVFGFHNGDFNYDGELNGDDYFILDSNILQAQASPPFPTAAFGGAVAPVPEPINFACAAAATLLLRRRRSV